MRSLFVSSCVLSLAACAAPVGGDPTGSIDAPIVGGTEVPGSTRPEVGMISNADSYCTGTLVAPDVVLTAAHCMEPEYTGTTPQPSTSFATWSPSGERLSYYVDRIQGWGLGDTLAAPFAGSDDLALYHLGFSVPEEVAMPAVVAHAPPAANAPAEAWGFGCFERPTLSGGKTKRYADFTYGATSALLCPGDSGGPAFAPAQSGTAIWGVSHGFYNASGADIFGQVPYYKYQIELAMRQWRSDAQLESDMDRPGADYSVVPLPSTTPRDCFAMCTRDASCRAFSYEPPAPGLSTAFCHLKSAVTDWVPMGGYVSGLPTSESRGTDRYGNDYRDFDVAEDREELCFAECARDAKCASYSYASSAGSLRKHCWLKSSAGTETPNAPVVSGAKRPFEVGFDRAAAGGADYRVFAVSSGDPAVCAQACANDDTCRAFSLAPAIVRQSAAPLAIGGGIITPWVAQCHLKHFAFDPVARAGWVSGLKRGLDMNTQRAGTTYRTFAAAEPRPEICQAACAADASCQSWTMVPQTGALQNGKMTVASPAMCELKSNVGAKTTGSAGYVSGIKGAEFFGADARY